jgi:iron complex outermembrane receptor protein
MKSSRVGRETRAVVCRELFQSLRSEPTSDLPVKVVVDYSKLGGRGTGTAIMPLGTTPARGGSGDPAAVAYYNNAAANFFIFPGAITPVPEYLTRLDTPIWGVMSQEVPV